MEIQIFYQQRTFYNKELGWIGQTGTQRERKIMLDNDFFQVLDISKSYKLKNRVDSRVKEVIKQALRTALFT